MTGAPNRSALAETLEAGSFVFTAELTPPVSAARQDLVTAATPFIGKLDAMNVTDGPRALVHMSSLAAAAILSSIGIEPVLQMTCRDRNRIAMQADLLGAAALGIHNVLALRGDDPPADANPPVKAVFDVDSREILEIARRMETEGLVGEDRKIQTPPSLFMGAADTPVDPPADWRPDGLIAKADAGAKFIQTQFCFDIGVIERYMGRLSDHGLTERLHFLIGIGPLASARSARWMRDNLWGVQVPDAIIDRLDQAADPAREGIAVCAELIDQMRAIDGIAGVHLMAPIRHEMILDVLAVSRSATPAA